MPTADGGALARLELFAGSDPSLLDSVAGRLRDLPFSSGETVLREGDRGDTFVIILEGRVEITRSRRAGGTVRVAEVGPGSILGELSVLTGRPRTATATALTGGHALVGGSAELADILHARPIAERVRRMASSRLAHDLRPVRVPVARGDHILLRPLLPEDRDAYSTAVRAQSAEFHRRRFFSPGRPGDALIDYLVLIDLVDHFAWLALDPEPPHGGLGVGRYVRSDDPTTAEVAFGVVDGQQGRGIGTVLFGAVATAAVEAGVVTLMAHVLAENRSMRAVFAKAGATTSYDGADVVRMEMGARAASGLLGPDVRARLAAAAHDIVTAGSIALTRDHSGP